MQIIPNLILIIPVGMLIGVLVAAPVGPVNVLCVQRAIERGFWGGLAAGIGSVLGDGLIALFAAFGVGAISGAVQYHRTLIQVVGGLALIIFGLRLYYAPPRVDTLSAAHEEKASLKDFIWDIPQTFFLTITNPGAVLGLFAIFGGVSTFVEVHTFLDAIVMVASIMAGSLLWWIGLSDLIGRMRRGADIPLFEMLPKRIGDVMKNALRPPLNAVRLQKINRGAGFLLIAFGGVLIGEMILKNAAILAGVF